MKRNRTTDLGERYRAPERVLSSAHLSRKQKLDILTEWELDEQLRMTATNENMQGGPLNQLRRVRDCIRFLKADAPRRNRPAASPAHESP